MEVDWGSWGGAWVRQEMTRDEDGGVYGTLMALQNSAPSLSVLTGKGKVTATHTHAESREIGRWPGNWAHTPKSHAHTHRHTRILP